MRIEQLSIRRLSIVVPIFLAIVSTSLAVLSAREFFEAARKFQAATQSRVIEVASQEEIKQLHHNAIEVGSSIGQSVELRQAMAEARGGHNANLIRLLDDPFAKGFVNAAKLDLVKLRVYDEDLRLLAESSGAQLVPRKLPGFLFETASKRSGAERYKALGGLWQSSRGPLYSVLVPCGGLRATGYLEILADPAFNLPAVAQSIQLPLSLMTTGGRLLFESPGARDNGHVPFRYVLSGADGAPAFYLIGWENTNRLQKDLQAALVATTAAFIALNLATVLAVLWLFNRWLLRPLAALNRRMHSEIPEESASSEERRSLMEIHQLVESFDRMAVKVRQSVQQLTLLSNQDGLTGISNRRHFDQVLQQEWQRLTRSKEEIALLIIDVDYFKKYNDAYGHLAGDDCLINIAQAIVGSLERGGDMAARYGGEEFAVLLPATGIEGATHIAQAIVDAVAKLNIRHDHSEVADRVTLSIGIASMLPHGNVHPYLLIARADEALYEAKRNGRNRIKVHARPAAE